MKHYKFPDCDCQFEVLSEDPLRLKFEPDISKIPLDCRRTWNLLSTSKVKGCFQLESKLGQSFTKKLQPQNIEQLSALIALIRPSCLETIIDKKSITQHYIDRKHNIEPIEYFHPSLEPILKDTYGLLAFQEGSMKIAQEIAGFNLQESDTLRKSIGHKDTVLMAKLKDQFINGCIKVGKVNQTEAEEIFSWIEKAQRYQFNKSHSISYSMNTYLSAYAKSHFPKQFFTSYLYHAKNKQDPLQEINELANDAKTFNIEIKTPSIKYRNARFKLIDEDIYFGISDIKGIGESVLQRLNTTTADVEMRLKKNIKDFEWIDFLVFISQYINSAGIKALISVGALSYMDLDRTKMLYDYEVYSKLSGREQKWCESKILSSGKWNGYFKSSIDTLSLLLTSLIQAPVGRQGGCSNKNRLIKIKGLLETLINPPYKLVDSPEWTAGVEESLLGLSITCASIESCNIENANTTCKEFLQKTTHPKYTMIAAQVDNVHEIKTKKGNNPGQHMAFLTVSDMSGSLDSIVCFPEEWIKFKRLLVNGNHIMLCGERGKEDGFIVKRIHQI